jgi:DNA sulfur modification protein DndE
MADRLYTSQQADEFINGLRMESRLDKATITRMAFTISLVTSGKDVPVSANFSGGELKRPTFFKEDEAFIQTLVAFTYDGQPFSEDEFYSNKSVIKHHIDNGARILWDLFESHGHDTSAWYSSLLDIVELKGAKNKQAKDLDIFIGRNILSNDPLTMELNNTQKHANSHLAIMGKPGVGKTQFLLKILTDIRIQSSYQTNFILFDYKGDVVDNETFIDASRSRTYRLLQKNESLPINPFILPEYTEQSIQLSAREKAESFASISSKFGPVQKGTLTEAITAAYAKRASSSHPYPDFQDVLELALMAYEEDKKKDDTLIEVLRNLANFNLFWSHSHTVKPIEKLSNRSMIIDVHAMPVLKELIAYLVIERLYKEMATLPDSTIKDGRRTLRTILVIDEAHNYLSQKNIFLQRIIREGRSKGIVVFFASQSPNDYQQKFFNFQELLEFAYVFQCEGVSASSIQDILGCSSRTSKDLQTEVARLEPFQVISRSSVKTEEFVKFSAEAFYKNY